MFFKVSYRRLLFFLLEKILEQKKRNEFPFILKEKGDLRSTCFVMQVWLQNKLNLYLKLPINVFFKKIPRHGQSHVYFLPPLTVKFKLD